MSAPHLLYVAWGFPPARTGGVHRALATVNAFADDGWRVTVFTAPREVFLDVTGADPKLESLIPRGVDVVRLPFVWPAQETDVGDYSPFRILTPRLWAKSRVWRDRRAFPETGYGPWRATLEQAALDLHRRDPIDLVIATTNPQVAVTAGMRLHAEAGVPHVVDFRDAWTLHTYSGERRLGPDSPEAKWEGEAIGSAIETWFVNEPLKRWHATTYPRSAARMHVVMNGYDRDLPAPTPLRQRPPGTPMTFGYLGTMTAVMPMREFVDGWVHARDADHLPDDARMVLRGYLGYYATPDPSLSAVVDSAADAGLSYGGPVSKTDVALTYSGFDVLVLILGGGEFVTSGKVFEYASTGLPIVSVLTPGNAAADILAAYPRHHPAADLSPTAIAAALDRAGADAAAPDSAERAARAQTFARAYRRDAQLTPRIAALREAITP